MSIEQAPLERVVTLHIEATDELGEQSRFALILEALGRHANLILCDKEGRILDCLRRIGLDESAKRAALPGLMYQPPEPVDDIVERIQTLEREIADSLNTLFHKEG